MFIGFYAKDLYRCADPAGLEYWVNEYDYGPDGGGPPICPQDPSDPTHCWEMSFLSGTERAIAVADGHIAPNPEQIFCGTTAGYPWSTLASYIESVGTQCKYLP
jgi:hypothetical protein